MTRSLLLVLPLVLLACPPVRTSDDDDDAADDDDDLNVDCPPEVLEGVARFESWNTVSCGSMHFGAASDDTQTLALSLDWRLGEEPEPEGFYEAGLSPLVGPLIHLQTGENLLHYDCNDALWLEEVVTRYWTGVSGTVELQVTSGGGWDARASLTFRDAVLSEPTSDSTCALPDATFPDLPIGWLPG